MCSSSAMTVATILQILIVFASGSLGARKIVETEDFGPIVDALAANDNANLVLQHAFTSDLGEAELVRPCLKRLLSSLGNKVGVCERETRLAILSLLGELLTRVPSQVCSRFFPPDSLIVNPTDIPSSFPQTQNGSSPSTPPSGRSSAPGHPRRSAVTAS